jgi:stalled ribosome alternative rescue factor ArfA
MLKDVLFFFRSEKKKKKKGLYFIVPYEIQI